MKNSFKDSIRRISRFKNVQNGLANQYSIAKSPLVNIYETIVVLI